MKNKRNSIIKKQYTGHLWLTPVILATQEAEMRRITVAGQPGNSF
jgi:hypothetical protein